MWNKQNTARKYKKCIRILFAHALMTSNNATPSRCSILFWVLQFPEAQEFSFPNFLQPAGGAGVRFPKPAESPFLGLQHIQDETDGSRTPNHYWNGGVLKFGYPQSSSILGGFSIENHPARLKSAGNGGTGWDLPATSVPRFVIYPGKLSKGNSFRIGEGPMVWHRDVILGRVVCVLFGHYQFRVCFLICCTMPYTNANDILYVLIHDILDICIHVARLKPLCHNRIGDTRYYQSQRRIWGNIMIHEYQSCICFKQFQT